MRRDKRTTSHLPIKRGCIMGRPTSGNCCSRPHKKTAEHCHNLAYASSRISQPGPISISPSNCYRLHLLPTSESFFTEIMWPFAEIMCVYQNHVAENRRSVAGKWWSVTGHMGGSRRASRCAARQLLYGLATMHLYRRKTTEKVRTFAHFCALLSRWDRKMVRGGGSWVMGQRPSFTLAWNGFGKAGSEFKAIRIDATTPDDFHGPFESGQ